MEFAKRELGGANGEAALALVAGVIKVLQQTGTFDREKVAAIFEEALRVAPDSSDHPHIEARELIKALLQERVSE